MWSASARFWIDDHIFMLEYWSDTFACKDKQTICIIALCNKSLFNV